MRVTKRIESENREGGGWRGRRKRDEEEKKRENRRTRRKNGRNGWRAMREGRGQTQSQCIQRKKKRRKKNERDNKDSKKDGKRNSVLMDACTACSSSLRAKERKKEREQRVPLALLAPSWRSLASLLTPLISAHSHRRRSWKTSASAHLTTLLWKPESSEEEWSQTTFPSPSASSPAVNSQMTATANNGAPKEMECFSASRASRKLSERSESWPTSHLMMRSLRSVSEGH